MAKSKVKFNKRIDLSEDISSFYFQKPDDFTFKAGQFVEVTLLNPQFSDIKGNTRSFSLTNAPFENEIIFTLKMRDSAFKQSFLNLKPGDEIMLNGPFGIFTLKKNYKKPIVFIAGGIGITPAVSMIKQAHHEQLNQTILLFYSVRTLADAVFLEEIDKITSQNKNIQYLVTFTQKNNEIHSYKSELGRVDAKMISKNLENISETLFYLAGPSQFVWQMYKNLKELNVKNEFIFTDEFTGY